MQFSRSDFKVEYGHTNAHTHRHTHTTLFYMLLLNRTTGPLSPVE